MAKKLDYSGPARPGHSTSGGGSRTFRGHVVPDGDKIAARSDWKRQMEAEQARNDWLVPLCILGGCSVIWLAVGLLVEGAAGAVGMGIAFSIQVALNAVVGLLAAWATAMLFGASFGPFWTAILKLAAASTTAATASLLPIGCFSLIVYIGVLVVMVQVLFDLDGSDAKWFTLFFIVVQVAGFVGLAYLLGDYLA